MKAEGGDVKISFKQPNWLSLAKWLVSGNVTTVVIWKNVLLQNVSMSVLATSKHISGALLRTRIETLSQLSY